MTSTSAWKYSTRTSALAAFLLLTSFFRTALAQAKVPDANAVNASSFGAVGDGATDDTAALQRALDSLKKGDTLVVPAGKTYRHSDVLTIRNPGVRLTGPGTLLATNEERSALSIDADNVILDGGLELKIATTTRRWNAPNQNKLNLLGHSGSVVRGISIDGSGAAGIFVFGASNYLLEDVSVENTRADGIHNTFGAHHGTIRRARIRNVGDDGVAVVSYARDAVVCHHILVESSRFYGNFWGRGFTVVGGEDITLRDIYAENSNAAALYISTEGDPWNTYSTKRVRVLGGEVKNSNVSQTLDHGAVLIYNARPGHVIEDVTIDGLKITDTRATASRQVGILVGKSGGVQRVQLKNFSISGGPGKLFVSDAPAVSYGTRGWTFNGVSQVDRWAAPDK